MITTRSTTQFTDAVGMKRPRQSYPMSADERDEIAAEFAEFGYRETDDPDEADRRRYYKVEPMGFGRAARPAGLHASNDLGRAQAVFATETKRRPRRSLPSAPERPCPSALAAGRGLARPIHALERFARHRAPA